MTTRAQHTPSPWRVSVSRDGLKVGGHLDVAYVLGQGFKAEANAAFIVRACNSYDDLLTCLTKYVAKFDDQSLTDKKVKAWLDEEWIPSVRALITKVGDGEEG